MEPWRSLNILQTSNEGETSGESQQTGLADSTSPDPCIGSSYYNRQSTYLSTTETTKHVEDASPTSAALSPLKRLFIERGPSSDSVLHSSKREKLENVPTIVNPSNVTDFMQSNVQNKMFIDTRSHQPLSMAVKALVSPHHKSLHKSKGIHRTPRRCSIQPTPTHRGKKALKNLSFNVSSPMRRTSFTGMSPIQLNPQFISPQAICGQGSSSQPIPYLHNRVSSVIYKKASLRGVLDNPPNAGSLSHLPAGGMINVQSDPNYQLKSLPETELSTNRVLSFKSSSYCNSKLLTGGLVKVLADRVDDTRPSSAPQSTPDMANMQSNVRYDSHLMSTNEASNFQSSADCGSQSIEHALSNTQNIQMYVPPMQDIHLSPIHYLQPSIQEEPVIQYYPHQSLETQPSYHYGYPNPHTSQELGVQSSSHYVPHPSNQEEPLVYDPQRSNYESVHIHSTPNFTYPGPIYNQEIADVSKLHYNPLPSIQKESHFQYDSQSLANQPFDTPPMEYHNPDLQSSQDIDLKLVSWKDLQPIQEESHSRKYTNYPGEAPYVPSVPQTQPSFYDNPQPSTSGLQKSRVFSDRVAYLDDELEEVFSDDDLELSYCLAKLYEGETMDSECENKYVGEFKKVRMFSFKNISSPSAILPSSQLHLLKKKPHLVKKDAATQTGALDFTPLDFYELLLLLEPGLESDDLSLMQSNNVLSRLLAMFQPFNTMFYIDEKHHPVNVNSTTLLDFLDQIEIEFKRIEAPHPLLLSPWKKGYANTIQTQLYQGNSSGITTDDTQEYTREELRELENIHVRVGGSSTHTFSKVRRSEASWTISIPI